MGIVRMGVPEDIVLYLKEISKTELFIETGTFHGWTSWWASKYFTSVKTIEFSEQIYLETKKKHTNLLNVEFIFGDSRIELKRIISQSTEIAIFWLDAHWCSFGSYGENDQCPLLDEIDIITLFNSEHIILIDDAHLFLCPPPLPNSTKYFPSISEITTKLSEKRYHTIVYEDVIISVPFIYKVDFINYIQQKITNNEIMKDKIDIKNKRKKKIKRLIKNLIFYKYWSNG